MRSDENAATSRHVVADDVRDRMRLAGPRRPLHHDPISSFEAPDDLNLLIVEGLREEKAAHFGRGCRFSLTSRFAEPMAQALPDVLRWRLGRAHHQRPCRIGKLTLVRNALDRLPEVLDVSKKKAVRSAPGEQHPTVGD